MSLKMEIGMIFTWLDVFIFPKPLQVLYVEISSWLSFYLSIVILTMSSFYYLITDQEIMLTLVAPVENLLQSLPDTENVKLIIVQTLSH